MNIKLIQEMFQYLLHYNGNMTCLILIGGNQGKLLFSVLLKEDG